MEPTAAGTEVCVCVCVGGGGSLGVGLPRGLEVGAHDDGVGLGGPLDAVRVGEDDVDLRRKASAAREPGGRKAAKGAPGC